MKKMLILFSILLLLSCGKKDKKTDETKPAENVTTEKAPESQVNDSGLTSAGMDLLNKDQMNAGGGAVDPEKLEKAKIAANNGDIQAMMALSGFYYQNKDMAEAKKWLKMAADKGEPSAMNNLGILYQQEGNTKEARNWFIKVAEKTNDKGIILGVASSYAKENNLSEARRWFEKAYNLGEKKVDTTIAEIYQRQKNPTEALKWYKKAIARGEKRANLPVGGIYFDMGRNNEAREYLLKAYKLGAEQTAMPIAITYHKQDNIEEAKKWYKIAAANGDKGAKKNLELINKAMASDSAKTIETTPFSSTVNGGLSGSGVSLTGKPKNPNAINTNYNPDNNQEKTPNPPKNPNDDPNNMFDDTGE